ncbi:MAG: SUMF1/EgtB/PvdO family nonheme iron enzyme [Pirellulales bacterium]|nr:SUMF1/EgtB/PvdO family nonheme iron enzyme [Pirellulales bacterium]
MGSPYYTTEVGEFENSESPYGTFDQGGNIWEWNETITDFFGYLWRGLRGSSLNLNVDDLHASHRSHSNPTNECGDVGFRVASIPEPASLALLACVRISVMISRRHWSWS